MNDEAATWVREHVWTDYMREAYGWMGRAAHVCACQRSTPYHWCELGRHAWCHDGRTPSRDYETVILDRAGTFPARLPEPFEHAAPYPSDRDELALRPLAFVWLADRVCETKCTCDCGHPAAVKPTPRPEPVPPPAKPVYVAVALPGLELIGATA